MTDQPQTTVPVREITPQLLDKFVAWTRRAEMFQSSPEGAAFAEELRQVLNLAREALALENRDAR